MSSLLTAMKQKIEEIILVEDRPFSFRDFMKFEIDGQSYEMSHDVFRNKIMQLKKNGVIQLAYHSGIAFYTLPGRKFTKAMTTNHTGVFSIINESLLKQTPIYKWLKNRPIQKQALHDIRLTFETKGIWNVFSKLYPDMIHSDNMDIKLPTSVYFEFIDILVTVHHTDTVSVAVSCSYRPIAIDIADILKLSEALVRIELQVQSVIDNYTRCNNSPPISVPSYRKWIVKMWHFGVDTIDTYEKDEFHVTFEEGINDLYRIYTKRLKDGKNKVRVERQEYPNQEYINAIVRKLFPKGYLVDPDKINGKGRAARFENLSSSLCQKH